MPRDPFPSLARWRSAISNALDWPVPAESLRAAGSLTDLYELIEHRPSVGFNRQIVRAKFLQYLYTELGCTSFLETGTRHASTSLAAHNLFGAEVFSVELELQSFAMAYCRVLLSRATGVHLFKGDSRPWLRYWLFNPRVGSAPMVYLDAHWNEDIPLRDEVRLAVQRGNCVVVIDDCEVEGEPEFGYDSQQNFAVSLSSIRAELPPERVVALQPACGAVMETGGRRGTLVLLIDRPLPQHPSDPFAASLLKPVPSFEALRR